MACKQVIRSISIPSLYVFQTCKERLAECVQSAIHFVPCINSTSGHGKDTRKQVYSWLHAKRIYTAGGMLASCSFGIFTRAGLPVVDKSYVHALPTLFWVSCWTRSK